MAPSDGSSKGPGRWRTTVVPFAAAVVLACGLPVAASTARAADVALQMFTAGVQCQPYTVPDGVYSVQILAVGGEGQAGGNSDWHDGGAGGHGAQVNAVVPVTPGETLMVSVAENGSDYNISGFPDGGTVNKQGAVNGGNAGGATMVATNANATPCGSSHSASDYLVVAGGGGGGGAANAGSYGGAGGSAGRFANGNGDTGRDGGGNTCHGYSGGAGSETGPGAGGGTACVGGWDGDSGVGDRGGNSFIGGGAGGGGWFGGGSGGDDADASGGGGAGSSYVTPSATISAYATDTTGSPWVLIMPFPSPWSIKPSLPAPTRDLAAATGADGTIYAIGGGTGVGTGTHTAQSSVYAYKPGDSVWRTMPSLPAPRSDLAAATGSDGTIYAIGGGDATGLAQSSVYAYRPGVDSAWRTLPSLPDGRAGLAAATGTDGTLYAIGGFSNLNNNPSVYQGNSTVYAYRPGVDSGWRTVASLPSAQGYLAASTGADGTIYAIGGWYGGGPFSSQVYAYTPSSNTWHTSTALPAARTQLAAVTGGGGTLYAIGGSGPGGVGGASSPATTVFAFTPGRDSAWRPVAVMPAERGWLAAAAGTDGNLYVMGGGDASGTAQSTVYAYPTSATVTSGHGFSLVTPDGSLAADDQGSSTSLNTPIIAWPPTGGINQGWTVLDDGAGDGYVELVNNVSGLCLDVYGDRTQPGSTVDQSTCFDQANQLWRVAYAGGFVATLQSKQSGLYLSLPAGGSQGGQLVINNFDGTSSEWTFTPIGTTVTPAPPSPTVINDTNSGITYSGSSWFYSPNRGLGDYQNDEHAAKTNGDSFSYTFTGTGISWIGEKNYDGGADEVYLDGVDQGSVSTYNAGRLVQQALYGVTGLSAGTHTLKVVKSSGTTVEVDALIVETASHLVNDTDPGITYSGSSWLYSPNRGYGDYQNDEHAARSNGDSFSYTFTGTGISWIGEKNSGGGADEVYVDGVDQGSVSRYNAGRLAQQVIYGVTGLSGGTHTLKVIKNSGTWLEVDALQVRP
jgi:N-acetylneuraminic acid mutarotase